MQNMATEIRIVEEAKQPLSMNPKKFALWLFILFNCSWEIHFFLNGPGLLFNNRSVIFYNGFFSRI